MAVGPRLEFRQSQSLVMTPQLRQAIKLLQFSNLEAAAYVEEELERNPLLERDERVETIGEHPAPDQRETTRAEAPDVAEMVRGERLSDGVAGPLDADTTNSFDPGTNADGYAAHVGETPGDNVGGPGSGKGGSLNFDGDDRGIEELVAARTTLRDRLGEQLRLDLPDPADQLIGAYLIALLDPAGRLSAEPALIAAAMGTSLERVEAVRARMQRFEPVGMFCRSLRECLAVQLAERNRMDPAMATLLDNLDLLARRDMRRLMQLCEVDSEDIIEMIAELRALDPKPGANFDATTPQIVVPDVLLRPTPDGGWYLELNPETMPRVLVNQNFHARVLPRASREERAYIAEHLASANWLVRSLQQRAQTILKVATEIVRQQDAFFRLGVGHLRPLILRDIATAVELHESTISRVTANKFIGTPRGTYELKYFFTTAIAGTDGESHSAEAIRHRIRTLITTERVEDILSDDAIVAILRREGVDIARRTVAKYREALRIPSSVQRRREKAVPA
jgi:RNA polymerase sigma-54 factor